MSKMVFIGQQPNSHDDEGNPIPIRPNSTGRRLVQMMGITDEAFEKHFIRLNVSPFHDPEGFDSSHWRLNADNMLPLLEGKRVVLLGPAVADAFGFERSSYDYASWFDHPEGWHSLFSVIPHPSGLNRVYNNPEVNEMVRSFLDGCWSLRDDKQCLSRV